MLDKLTDKEQFYALCGKYGIDHPATLVYDPSMGHDVSLPWEQWIEAFCLGYEDAKSWGDANDLSVFFGYEANYGGTEFLIYGVDKEWLIRHPEIKDASVGEQYRLIHKAGGLVIHAHPFREAGYIPDVRLYPQWVDGVEGVNATHSNSRSMAHNDPAFDQRAIAYAGQHGLPLTAGSDIHTTQLLGGGIAFRRRLRSARDYVQAVLNGEDYVLTNGEAWFDKAGNRIG